MGYMFSFFLGIPSCLNIDLLLDLLKEVMVTFSKSKYNFKNAMTF